jgi:curli production assembly/transport component CsgE
MADNRFSLRAKQVFAALAICILGPAHAESAAIPGAGSLGGIAINQTVTVAGQEFYRQFVALWRESPHAEGIAITVHERPSARWGSQVWIEYAQKRIFQAALPLQRAAIGSLGERAVEAAIQSVVDAELQRQWIRDIDLGRDEI